MRLRPGLLIAVLLVPSVAAAEPCAVEVRGAATEAWLHAAAAPSTGDCARLEIEVKPGGKRARVVFTTRDGRTAVRELDDPSELAPALSALEVTMPPRAPETPPAVERPALAPIAIEPDRVVAPPPPAEEPRVTLVALAGARGGNDVLTPLLGADAVVRLRRWDAGVFVRGEMHYRRLTDREAAPPRTEGVAFGLTMGRREPVGANVAFVFGGRVSLSMLRREHAEDDNEGFTEARAGGYIGLIAPRASRTRVRVALDEELPAVALGPEAPRGTMPGAATTLTLGVEYDP